MKLFIAFFVSDLQTLQKPKNLMRENLVRHLAFLIIYKTVERKFHLKKKTSYPNFNFIFI